MGNNVLKNILCVLFSVVMTVALAACGGGGGGGDNTPSAQSVTVSGVAASGDPIADKNVYLKDSNGVVIGPELTDSHGNYSFDVTGLTAPFYIYVDVNNDGLATDADLYSVSTGPGTGNINPLTNLIVAVASGSENPADVYNGTGGSINQTSLDQALTGLQYILSSLLNTYGVSGVNPLEDSFVADHTGLDLLFDDVVVDIDPVTGIVTFTSSTNYTFCEMSIDLIVSDPLVTAVGHGAWYDIDGFIESIRLDINEGALSGSEIAASYQNDYLTSDSITAVTLLAGVVTIEGAGLVNGVTGYTFTATVTDGTPYDEVRLVFSDSTGTVYDSGTVSVDGSSYTVTFN
ncbi:hypothetical protein BMS3Abin09_00109 [bacterium BMS3Abin09]|nr:hypothetical protein BMS3Abin09_00109 [bacterium BMS3Abin09]HDH34210.1 hypothetical protein [Nitrospirota bacterium]